MNSPSTTPPPHPDPHIVLVVVLRTDDQHIQRRLNTVMGVAATYDTPPNTSPHAFAKYVHEITAEETQALETLVGKQGVDLLNLYDQYPEQPTDPYFKQPSNGPHLRDVTDEPQGDH